jgi:uncharacterized peroxidase-related enzyme
MTRISLFDPAAATGRTKLLLDSLQARRGRVTTMVRVLANSPAALNAYFSFNSAMAGCTLPAALRERIAIAVAQANGCETCLAAHTAFGKEEGIPDEELSLARRADSSVSQDAAALRFALQVLKTCGRVSDEELAAVRAAGFGDAAIMEILGTVFINAFTNAVNHVAETEPDYPRVE